MTEQEREIVKAAAQLQLDAALRQSADDDSAMERAQAELRQAQSGMDFARKCAERSRSRLFIARSRYEEAVTGVQRDSTNGLSW